MPSVKSTGRPGRKKIPMKAHRHHNARKTKLENEGSEDDLFSTPSRVTGHYCDYRRTVMSPELMILVSKRSTINPSRFISSSGSSPWSNE